jgi:hypothetical protein
VKSGQGWYARTERDENAAVTTCGWARHFFDSGSSAVDRRTKFYL